MRLTNTFIENYLSARNEKKNEYLPIIYFILLFDYYYYIIHKLTSF